MLLSIRSLTANIKGGDSLAGFNADFPPGVTAVIGQEGSGKAALFAVLAGKAKPVCGTILIGMPGNMVPLKEFKGSVGYLAASIGFPRGWTIEHTLLRESSAKGLKKDYAWERVEAVLRLLGLDAARGTRIADCTADALRRVAIAATLLPDPELLLLEEPFEGLLSQEQMRLSAILAAMPRGKTVLYAAGDSRHADVGPDRVVFVSQGQCVLSAPKDRLVASLREKVWRVTVSPDDAWQIRLAHVVSGQQRVFREQQLRLVAEEPPAGVALAVPEEPTVGDAYAWCMAKGPEKILFWMQHK